MGFSAYEHAGRPIFIKHFSELDNGNQESFRIKTSNDAKAKGLLSREDKMQIMLKEGYWSISKEDEIEKIKKEISDTEMIQKNLVIKRQILNSKQKIRDLQSKLNDILKEKEEVFGFCLEDFVDKKLNELIIQNSFYKDAKLKEKLYSEEEFDRLPEKEMIELIGKLNNFYVDFGHDQIKRICACSFFFNLFSLASDNIYNFYGKFVIDLSILQVNLFSQGRYFKSLIESKNQQASPPSDVVEDPDKMIEWYESISNVSQASADGISYVGASKEELKKMAGGSAISVGEYASKKGNSLSTKDFIEMHGM